LLKITSKINTKGQEISWPNATYYLGCFRSSLLSKNAAENKYATQNFIFFLKHRYYTTKIHDSNIIYLRSLGE